MAIGAHHWHVLACANGRAPPLGTQVAHTLQRKVYVSKDKLQVRAQTLASTAWRSSKRRVASARALPLGGRALERRCSSAST